MATMAVSVGTGVVRPLGGPDQTSALAQEYYRRYGPRSTFTHFMEWVRAKGLHYTEARQLQDHLVNRLGFYRLAGHVPERLDEGLGYSPDSDGRGKGLSGGSMGSANRDATFLTDDEAKRVERERRKRDALRGMVMPPGQDGSAGVRNDGTGLGAVRVPGGPIDTNEGGLVRVRVLSYSLVEVNIGGTVSVHNWMVLPEALQHRVSTFGKATSRSWLPKLNNWLFNEAKPGEEAVIDPLRGVHFITKEQQGFAYLSKNWGTPL